MKVSSELRTLLLPDKEDVRCHQTSEGLSLRGIVAISDAHEIGASQPAAPRESTSSNGLLQLNTLDNGPADTPHKAARHEAGP